MTPLVRLHDVSKQFGDHRAVDRVSFAVEAGEVLGLIGANGAGKTTTMRMLLGLIPPTSGRVDLFGAPPSRASRSRLGYLPQGLGLYADLTVGENLDFVAAAYRSERPELGPELAPLERDLVGGLSLGHRRQVAFAAALSHRPELLVLDEPTSGVGPLGRADLWRLIGRAADAGTGVLVSTHYMEEAEQCDRLVMMAAGRMVAEGSTAAITASVSVVEVGTKEWRPALLALEAAGLRPAMIGASLRVAGATEERVRMVLERSGIEARVASTEPRFDDAFVALAGA